MTRFATGVHLASWVGRTPLDNSSGKHTGRAECTPTLTRWPSL